MDGVVAYLKGLSELLRKGASEHDDEPQTGQTVIWLVFERETSRLRRLIVTCTNSDRKTFSCITTSPPPSHQLHSLNQNCDN
jgi:hypothetical protein